MHHRIFTDDEERVISEDILRDYIIPARHFIEADFRALVLQKYRESGRDSVMFQCLNQFIHDFKIRHGFSSRRFHVRRRQRQTGRGDIAQWIEDMKGLLAAVNPHRVVNCDETAWWIIPQGLLCWDPVGQEGVSVTIDGNDKDAITALASVTAASEKLSLFLIAKGRTPRVEHGQLGDSENHWTTHSPSGWTTKETFRTYLEWLREWYGDENTIHLVRSNSRFGLFHSITFRLSMGWPIREPIEPLIITPDIAIGDFEESVSSPSTTSHDSGKHYFLWG
jgi:hypothetical protein